VVSEAAHDLRYSDRHPSSTYFSKLRSKDVFSEQRLAIDTSIPHCRLEVVLRCVCLILRVVIRHLWHLFLWGWIRIDIKHQVDIIGTLTIVSKDHHVPDVLDPELSFVLEQEVSGGEAVWRSYRADPSLEMLKVNSRTSETYQ
jgi:hypothetical protein